jgi:hypothetical protein
MVTILNIFSKTQTEGKKYTCEISGSRGGEYKDESRLGYSTM